MRILVVDDDICSATSIADILSGKYSVSIACSACSALDLLEKQDFDLVISDFDMPDMNGLEFLDTLRKTIPGLYVLFVTSIMEEDTLRLLYDSDAEAVYVKPLDPREFADRIAMMDNRRPPVCASSAGLDGERVLEETATRRVIDTFADASP